MIRIEGLEFSYSEVFDTCLAGVNGNDELKECLSNNKEDLDIAVAEYIDRGHQGTLSSIAPLTSDMGINPILLNGITKKNLISLYSYYFVKKSKPNARRIYDKIMSLANDKCPFCGGIGKPENLDHYLAKKYFPQFSILPQNLIPSCRDCNMGGKGQTLAATAAEQVIHPFLDHEKFFNEQWIFAEYQPSGVDNDQGVISYYVNPPEYWCDIDKSRVELHFLAFNLAEVYSLQAAENLNIIFKQIEGVRDFCTNDEKIIDSLLQGPLGEIKEPNHWRKGFFQALINYLSRVD